MNNIIFTKHAKQRMNQRGINMNAVRLALAIGKRIFARDTLFVFLGKRALKDFGNLAETHEGITLVIDPKSNTLLTVFRNRQMTRKIRHKKQRFRQV